MALDPTPGFRFNGTNQSAQKVAARQAARFVTRISTETLQAIRALIVRSIREGIPPYEAARMIRSMVGLSAPAAQAAMNYREHLINQGLSLARVNALVDRYVEKRIRERAETIARTEIMDALNTGVREAARQARQDGFLGKGTQKEWITTPDERLCPYCAPMDGVRVPLDGSFQTGLGESAGPPLHPRCRCALAIAP